MADAGAGAGRSRYGFDVTAGLTVATGAGALVLGIGVPWVFMQALAPSILERPGGGVTNYRGRIVSPGLGIVWLVWGGCAILGGIVALTLSGDTMLPILTLAGPLALVAFATGLVDDAFGSADAKGFRGHLKAMAHGRLTTGGLKLIGIGLASAVVAFVIGEVAPWGAGAGSSAESADLVRYISGSLIAGGAIALTSNFVNLTDLRPGRALKVYTLLALAGVACVSVSPAIVAGHGALTPIERVVDIAALTAFALGPVLAVWRYDLGEVGMLGDAGANPMGAVAGLLIVAGLPLWGLVAYAVVLFALNAVSERVSFTRVIESSRVLGWVDGLGRAPDGPLRGDSAKEPPHETTTPE